MYIGNYLLLQATAEAPQKHDPPVESGQEKANAEQPEKAQGKPRRPREPERFEGIAGMIQITTGVLSFSIGIAILSLDPKDFALAIYAGVGFVIAGIVSMMSAIKKKNKDLWIGSLTVNSLFAAGAIAAGIYIFLTLYWDIEDMHRLRDIHQMERKCDQLNQPPLPPPTPLHALMVSLCKSHDIKKDEEAREFGVLLVEKALIVVLFIIFLVAALYQLARDGEKVDRDNNRQAEQKHKEEGEQRKQDDEDKMSDQASETGSDDASKYNKLKESSTKKIDDLKGKSEELRKAQEKAAKLKGKLFGGYKKLKF
jgi:hypothetical protein